MPQVPIDSRLSCLTDAEPFERAKTMERKIWDALPEEDAVRALKAIPLSTRQVYMLLPVASYRSIRRALYRLRHDDRLYMERDGKEFLYARRAGAAPPYDGRGQR